MKDPNYMGCLDIFITSDESSQHEDIKKAMELKRFKTMPLMSWDIYMMGYQERISETIKNNELKEVLSLAKKYKWQNDLKTAFKENDYEALIVTDKNQNIIWVNDGFTKMNGYSKSFAKNKTPKFLQGEDTSITVRNRIRQNVIDCKPFKEVIINYKKDGTPYKCQVNVIPLYNEQTTHFMAFEKEVV
ncbi:MAG: PAS domain-containing protein [Winogradskyella sp.]|uniref:PAS domain-containing protein n=1 Tax=Winogradskyella sp. TaxID=1883156 RepID=UPI0025E2010F|nr:PAS domain-containing protein [Winogradskyella sp.]NRB59305.1 PAS domain-containing protein [Winogradskyella sp.]